VTDADKELFGKRYSFIAHVTGYGVSLNSDAVEESNSPLPPQLLLQEVENIVRSIEEAYPYSKYSGVEFKPDLQWDDRRWDKMLYEYVFAEKSKPRLTHNFLRDFYDLSKSGEYWSSRYSVRIEAAREALQTVYPYFFHEVPTGHYTVADGESELEVRRRITEKAWPAAQQFNSVIDKIAEIVSGSGYRSRLAREKTKLKQRAKSATRLIDGLLEHHKSLTVVALRLSIRQDHARVYLGDKMQKALTSLIANRRDDSILGQAVGYFWVLQESFHVTRRAPAAPGTLQVVKGKIALHYDLVMFFNGIRLPETDAIAQYIGDLWKHYTSNAGLFKRLSGKAFKPHFSSEVNDYFIRTKQLPQWAEICGLVEFGTKRHSLLRGYATYMVASALLRKPQKLGDTLIKSNTRRFGKSDLLTGCGLDKPGRGNKLGQSAVPPPARRRRPKYVPPKLGSMPSRGDG